MLQLVLKPKDPDFNARKFFQAPPLDDTEGDEDGDDGFEVVISGRSYTATVFDEEEYDDGYQIEGKEGQIVLHEYLTYGYGETVEFSEVVRLVNNLRAWADDRSMIFDHSVRIGANYW